MLCILASYAYSSRLSLQQRSPATPENSAAGPIGTTSAQRIASGKFSKPLSDDQRVIGLEVGQVIRINRILAPTDLSDDSCKAVNYELYPGKRKSSRRSSLVVRRSSLCSMGRQTAPHGSGVGICRPWRLGIKALRLG